MTPSRRQLLKLLSLTGLSPFLPFPVAALGGDPECLTTPDIQGPFYIPGAPFSPQLAPADAPGTPLFITGTVYARDCETPLPGALVDVWHANDGGAYEDDHYRGRINAAGNGQYSFATLLPGKYLNGAQFRPRHFHYKVSFEGAALTTQIYFEGDTSIPIDPWASDPAAAERIIPLDEDPDGNLHGLADIVLDVDPPVIDSLREPGGQSGYLRSLSPNPVRSEGRISLSLSRSASVAWQLFALDGRLVSQRPVGHLPSGIHDLPFRPNSNLGLRLPPGLYVLRLLLDDQPVDARRWLL